MAVTKVVNKTGEIDGKPITWNVLAITSFIGGEFQTLELKLSKTEALLANMLLNNKEEKPETVSRAANSEEVEAFNEKNISEEDSQGWLDKLNGNKK